MNVNQLMPGLEDLLRQSAVKDAVQDGKHRGQNEKPLDSAARKTENPTADSVEISPDGIRKAEGIDKESQKTPDDLKGRIEQMENARAQGEAAGESMKVQMKCMQIAMRIINGDEVPREDHRYLAEHDPKLYSEAMTRRMPKEKPHKYERLSEDEKSDRPDNAGDFADAKPAGVDGSEITVETSADNATGEPPHGGSDQ